MTADNIKFVDAENWSGGGKFEKLTFSEIVLPPLNRIALNSNVEFRGGYWEKREIYMGGATNVIKTYIPDTREVYTNSVIFLMNLIYPHADKELKEALEISDKKTLEVFEKYTFEPEREEQKEEEKKEEERRGEERKKRKRERRKKKKRGEQLWRESCGVLKRGDYVEGKTYEDTI